ncbi:8-oxo-dGTP diphosphatase MutT [Fontisphaera persica]|uniref:8-oxo-dGTP diphosphatase MutT n=1 Tax=Fontisphaera persica TaxID=2974023 RepID=UPI0024BFED27|nr:8-oxo-dGTP diphosphatase MutT [Fontisphaera persica]WCJ59604.1 8-oxo-dGTP diphosphatase MutT [Fontisphaera persica]
MPAQRIEVAAGLIFRHGRLLIAQRRRGDHLGGAWEFPGGKREPGESYEACLARELQEELGVQVQVGELVESVDHDYPEKKVHLRFFLCRLLHGEPHPLGCAAVAWVSREELTRYHFPPADARLLAKLQAHSEWWAE